MLRQIQQLVSGECRWIGREDVHVYCHAPIGRDAKYSVICPDAGRDGHEWVDAKTAARIVEAIVG